MQYPELPFFAFLSAFLVLVPLPWHWRARNVATLALIFWLFVTDMIYGINASVWAGNLKDSIPIWCDITTKFTAGASYALPLCTLCICKHLEMVSSSRKVSYSADDRRRRTIFEIVVCFVVPIIFMVLHYVVQGHRYDIVENIGCQAAIYISLPAVFLIWFPQLLFSVITLVYAALALHNFIRRRLIFASHLQSSNSALTTSRYLRLIAMALAEMFWGTTLTAYNLYNNVSGGLRPWTTWADVHSNFGRVDLFPMMIIPKEYVRIMMLFWWTIPASSLIFFAFFGFGEDAMKEYRRVWIWFKTTVLRKRDTEKKHSSLGNSSVSGRTLPRRLMLSNFKTTSSTASSPSRTYHAKSPMSDVSHMSQSTITLATYSPGAHKISKADEARGDRLPSYDASCSPTSSTHPTIIGVPIDAKRDLPRPQTRPSAGHLGLPEIDDSDAFTISSFSHYEGSLPSGSRLSTSSTTYGGTTQAITTMSTTTTFNVVPPTPPHPPPSPRFPVPQHSLPPPPRKQPRAIGSLSSLLSNATSFMSNSGSRTSLALVQDVPEDVGPASYTQPAGMLAGLPDRDDVLVGHASLSRSASASHLTRSPSQSSSSKVLGVAGGGIMVTVQRQASVDGIV